MNEDLNKELKEIVDYFDRYGHIWIDAYQNESDTWHEHNILQLRMKRALGLIQKEKLGTAIDLGCGAGYGLVKMKVMGFRRVIGIDISDRMLATARELLNKHNLTESVELYKADVQDLPMISSGSVDVCIALGVIEYLNNDEGLLQEINRILNIGRVAVIQMRNYDCMRSRTIEKFKIRAIKKLESSKKFRWLRFFVKEPICFREHKASEFARSARACGFEIERELYSYFYPLYPLDLIPEFQNLIMPFNNFLSKQMEAFSGNRLARYLTSMYIAKIQKVRDLNEMQR